MRLCTALLPISALMRRQRTTRDADDFADLLKLACGPCPNAPADEARRYLREEAGWHAILNEVDEWTSKPCRVLAGRHPKGSVLPFPGVRTGSAACSAERISFPHPRQDIDKFGAPGKTRTPNPQIRSLVLYPLSYGREPFENGEAAR